MTPEEKIRIVLETIKAKVDISPEDSVIEYCVGREYNKLDRRDELMILNRLENEGIIQVIENYGNDSCI